MWTLLAFTACIIIGIWNLASPSDGFGYPWLASATYWGGAVNLFLAGLLAGQWLSYRHVERLLFTPPRRP